MTRKYAPFRTARAAMPEATQRHYATAFALLRMDLVILDELGYLPLRISVRVPAIVGSQP
jgi:hypothetical protein